MTVYNGTLSNAGDASTRIFVRNGDYLFARGLSTFTGSLVLRYRTYNSLSWVNVATVSTGAAIAAVKVEVSWGDSEVELYAETLTVGSIVFRFENDDSRYSDRTYWDDLRFPAASINPAGQTNGAAVDIVETNFPSSLLFDSGTVEMCSGNAQLPHSTKKFSSLRPHIHWMKTTAAAGNVVWHFYYRKCNAGAVADAWSSVVVGTDEITVGSVANVEYITSFGEIPIGDATSQNIAWRLYRKADDAGDTYGADARLLELDIHYIKDSLGSTLEFNDGAA